LRSLQQESQELRLESASLSRPARIERVARKSLGLTFPSPEQIITVD
jgi:cell division protein FtsL